MCVFVCVDGGHGFECEQSVAVVYCWPHQVRFLQQTLKHIDVTFNVPRFHTSIVDVLAISSLVKLGLPPEKSTCSEMLQCCMVS